MSKKPNKEPNLNDLDADMTEIFKIQNEVANHVIALEQKVDRLDKLEQSSLVAHKIKKIELKVKVLGIASIIASLTQFILAGFLLNSNLATISSTGYTLIVTGFVTLIFGSWLIQG